MSISTDRNVNSSGSRTRCVRVESLAQRVLMRKACSPHALPCSARLMAGDALINVLISAIEVCLFYNFSHAVKTERKDYLFKN